MTSEVGPVPWEDASVPFPANLGLTWWETLVAPARFFRGVWWEGPLARPVLYFLSVAILAATLGLFWFVWGPWGAAADTGLTLELQLLAFFLTPLVMLAALGVVTLVQHLFVLLLAPEHRGIGSTATVLCYSSGVGLVSALFPPALGMVGPAPGLGGVMYVAWYFALALAVQVWYVALMVLGVRAAHSTTTGRAAAIVLLPIGIALTVTAVLVIAAIALFALADLPF